MDLSPLPLTGGVNVCAKLTAMRADSKESKGYDVVISTPNKKSVGALFSGSSNSNNLTQILEGVDPNASITVHLLDQETQEQVKAMDIPIRDLQSNLTSTHLFHDGITVLIEYEITRDGRKVLSTEDKLDDLINAIGFAEKPWYLEATTVYSSFKLALLRVFSSGGAVGSSAAVQTVIAYLVAATAAVKGLTMTQKILAIGDSETLIDQIDTYLHSGFSKFDFTTEQLRAQLAEQLIEFRTSVLKHSNWIKSYAGQSTNFVVNLGAAKIAELKEVGARYVASAKDLLALYKIPTGNLNVLIIQALQYYDKTKELVELKAKEISGGGKVLLASYIDKKISTDSTWKEIICAGYFQATNVILKKAQPYVHSAVTFSTPYIEKAVNVSKPYLIQAAPIANSVADKILKQVESHPAAEKIVKKVTEKSLEAFECSTSYVIPEPLAGTYDKIFQLSS